MRKKLSTLLDRASALELSVAAIYDHFSKQFDRDPTLAQFWALFAEAERYHSLIIQMQKMGMGEATSDASKIAEWEGEIADTQAHLSTLLKRLEKEGWQPSISEAFELAQDIEGRSLEVQSRSFALFDTPAIKELVTTLHQEDVQHRSKLLTARERFAAA